MKTDAELREALIEARRALESLLDREGCRISEALAMQIEQIYTGRFVLRPRRLGPEYCPKHEWTRNPCGLCPPLET